MEPYRGDEPYRVERVTIVVDHANGAVSTFHAEQPLLADLEIEHPKGWQPVIMADLRGETKVPEIDRMKIEFWPSPERPILIDRFNKPVSL